MKGMIRVIQFLSGYWYLIGPSGPYLYTICTSFSQLITYGGEEGPQFVQSDSVWENDLASGERRTNNLLYINPYNVVNIEAKSFENWNYFVP